MPSYNHMYTIAFTVISPNDGENVTADELRAGLAQRLHDLRNGDEIIEACGMPDDTEIEEEDGSPALSAFPEYADIMTAEDFQESCDIGAFISSDGSGYWATEAGESGLSVWATDKPDWATHVAWYNK